jgi:hypothetical protein
MSDQQLTDQEPRPKAKHAGGRPKKPKPAQPLPPPARYSLEETLLMGDQAAAKGTPAAQLRWVSKRALLVKEYQAQKDADRHDVLEIDNKRLQESIEAFERTKQNLENELGKKDRDLVAARTENDEMAAKLREMADQHAKLLDESTSNISAIEKKAKGLLAIVRCACLQMQPHSEGQRIEYAAQLMRISGQALKDALRLAELVKNAEAHRELYAAHFRNLPQGPIEQKRTAEQFAEFMRSQEEMIERSVEADRKRITIEFSKFIPDEVMNQAFELLGVTREQVVRQLDTEKNEREA